MQGPAKLQDGEIDCTLTKLRRKHRKLLARLRAAHASGSKRRIREATRNCLRSAAFRTVAALDANKKLPGARRQSPAACLAIGPKIKWGKPLNEQVRVVPVRKKSCGHRPICNFGLQHRSAQVALRRVLSPGLTPQPWQFEFKPGGVSTAIKTVRQKILAGNTWVARLDVKNFFPSFTLAGVRQLLPLSRAIILNHVLGKRLSFALPSGGGTTCSTKPTSNWTDGNIMSPCSGASIPFDTHALFSIARRGVPQGSALSPLVAALAVSRLGPLPGVVHWVDDFAVLGLSQEEVAHAAKALVAAVAAVPGGSFSLVVKGGPDHVKDGFTFLGHDVGLSNGKLEVSPAFQDDFYKRLIDMDAQFDAALPNGDKSAAFNVLGRMWVFARSWCSTFNACDDIGDYLKQVKYRIEIQLPATGHSWADVQAFHDPGAKFKLQKYS